MYARHFGFQEDPFGAAADPKFLYFSREHAEALAALHYGLLERRGVLVLAARPGMGKTTMLHHLLKHWKDKADTAFLYRPPETREEMIAGVLEDLGLEAGPNYAESCRRLRDHAVESRRLGRRLLLFFDEVQGIPPEVLEDIRRLSNLETPDEKLIDILLVGHAGLVLEEALGQRVAIWAGMEALDAAEVRRYVEHRMRAAGRSRGRVFSRGALARISELSGGIPRNINTICFQALSAAFAKGEKRVGRSAFEPTPQHRLRFRWAAAAGVLLLVGGLVGAGRWAVASGQWSVASGPPAVASVQWPVASSTASTTVSAAPLPVVASVQRPVASSPAPTTVSVAPAPRVVPPQLPEPDRGRVVRVARGETMRRIALREYGRWDRQIWERIRSGNPGLTDPSKLRAGLMVVLPEFGIGRNGAKE
jgi:general secretion pathway protein A